MCEIVKTELLAPAGDFEKLKTALHFGADAVYVGGSEFSLRANAKNFTKQQLEEACSYVRERGKKIYVAVNVFAKNGDFDKLPKYLAFLQKAGVHGVIVSDPGVIEFCKKYAPVLEIHISTQANTTNKYSAKFWADQGAKRIVLARETSLKEVGEIRDYLPSDVQIEAFVHGAMCISYSGRCLLSAVLAGRSGNRGDCVQACRWEYEITEKNRKGERLPILEDDRGTYILNSKDLNMLGHIGELIESGVYSFKIEGRMKSQYYVASVVNAYRKAIDGFASDKNYKVPALLSAELEKNSHRDYTTGFYYGEKDSVCLETSQPKCDYAFIALVEGYDDAKGAVCVQQRNRFAVGDVLEILSPDDRYFGKTIEVNQIFDENGNSIDDAKLVQQKLYISTEYRLGKDDILRKKV